MEKLSATFQSRQELWQSRISACRSSGLTAKDWCEKKQVSLSALRYWITKSNSKDPQRTCPKRGYPFNSLDRVLY